MSEQRRSDDSDVAGSTPMAATLWVLLGLGSFLLYFLRSGAATALQKPPVLVGIYLISAVGLDLFVGASRRVTLQRITPIVVLALLVTPGVPPYIALLVDLMATICLVATSRISTDVVAQAGRSLLPAACTALFLSSRAEWDLDTYFFATWVFLVVSLLTRSSEPPFRTDLFLIVSFPAVALMLRSLAELALAYVLLTIPLLFLLTTVDTTMLRRYFQLQKQLDTTKSVVEKTQRARQESERESRRKGVLLDRREKQLELLNGLGRQLDEAKAAQDLGRYLIEECRRLIGAEVVLVMFCDGSGQRITRVICDVNAPQGVKAGDAVPPVIRAGLSTRPPWNAPLWQGKRSFLTVPLGQEGWLFLGHAETEAFPDFLEGFFSAVGRHAGSAALALRRLAEVRELARREASEKELVALEKEKVAEQNQNLRSLISSFETLTEASLSSDAELLRQASDTVRRLTGAEQVVFRAPDLRQGPDERGILTFQEREWPSFLYLRGEGPAGNVLCLAARPESFSQSDLEWCTLLRDFLDKTLENGSLHRRIKASLSKLKDTQQEVVRSSQWAAAGRLAANAAHELNTPLGAIRLAAEQVKFFQGEGTPEPAKQGLLSIIRSVDRCREVTDRLLITSRPVDHGELPTRPEQLEILPILRDAVASVQPYLRASGIKLAVHRLNGDQVVFVVLQDLYWAVVNILKNGIDAVNEGTGTDKRMAIGVETQGEYTWVTIADNGTGVPDELREKIFEPFFTTKKIGQGNGLGLALSRQNLIKWGGDVSLAKDPPDGGAIFTIKVPLVGTAAARKAQEGQGGMGTSTPREGSS